MTRFETLSVYDSHNEGENTNIDPKYLEKLERNTVFLVGVQVELAKRYYKKEYKKYDEGVSVQWWVNTFGRDFREHIVREPEHAQILKNIEDQQKIQNTKTISENYLEELEKILYSATGAV